MQYFLQFLEDNAFIALATVILWLRMNHLSELVRNGNKAYQELSRKLDRLHEDISRKLDKLTDMVGDMCDNIADIAELLEKRNKKA